ncbi:MAG: hypothetical protein JNM93_05000, partial [Bacteriovoracaceae bacterium]|nr:hypothetical protein [Bacteriovoracaceae bacterium]
FKNGLSCGYEAVSIPLRVSDCEKKFGRYIHIDENYKAVIGQNLLVKTENNEFKWELHLGYKSDYPEVSPAGYALDSEKAVTNSTTQNRLDSFYYTNKNEWLYYDKTSSAEYIENVKTRSVEYAEYAAKILQSTKTLDALVVDFNSRVDSTHKVSFFHEVIKNFNLPRYKKYEIAYAVNISRLIKLLGGSNFKLAMLDQYYAKSLLVNIYSEEHAQALKVILSNAKDLSAYKSEILRFGVNANYKNYFTNLLK